MTVLAHVLLAVSWKALAVGALAFLVSRLPKIQRNPAAHHALWLAAAAALLCLPPLEGLKRTAPASRARIEMAAPFTLVEGPVDENVQAQEPSRIPNLLAALYLAGLAVVAGRLAYGWLSMRAFLHDARAIEHPALDRIALRFGLSATPPLLTSGRFCAPMTAAFLCPSIVLPEDHARWTPERLEAVFAHECAHIARGDTRAALLIAVTRAIYWFHPVAWRLRQQTARLMEQACDDFALRVLDDSNAYADALLATASQKSTANLPTIGALAMASHLSSRIDRILSGVPGGAGILRRRALIALGLAASAAAIAAALLTPALAQQAGVTLEGVVVDASGARVPGVALVVRDRSRGITEATVSGADGSFAFRGLAPSERYELEAEAGGFARVSTPVSLLENKSLDIELHVGAMHEAFIVEADAPEASTPQARAPQRIRVGGNVQRSRLIRQVQPTYPEGARAEGVEGTVLLEAVISASGQPVSLAAVNNLVDSRLVAAASDAVSQWRYEPARLNGQPVEVSTTITVGFRLRR